MSRNQLKALRVGDRVYWAGTRSAYGVVKEVVFDHGIRVQWDNDPQLSFFDYTDTSDGIHGPECLVKINTHK